MSEPTFGEWCMAVKNAVEHTTDEPGRSIISFTYKAEQRHDGGFLIPRDFTMQLLGVTTRRRDGSLHHHRYAKQRLATARRNLRAPACGVPRP